MSDYTDLIERLRGNDMPWSVKDAADALEAQARRIAELEAECEKLGRLYLEVIADWNTAIFRIETLESTLKLLSESNYYPDSILDKRIREDRAARAAYLGEKE